MVVPHIRVQLSLDFACVFLTEYHVGSGDNEIPFYISAYVIISMIVFASRKYLEFINAYMVLFVVCPPDCTVFGPAVGPLEPTTEFPQGIFFSCIFYSRGPLFIVDFLDIFVFTAAALYEGKTTLWPVAGAVFVSVRTEENTKRKRNRPIGGCCATGVDVAPVVDGAGRYNSSIAYLRTGFRTVSSLCLCDNKGKIEREQRHKVTRMCELLS